MLSQTETVTNNEPIGAIESWKWSVLALVSAAFFIVVLDFSVVNVALASIETDLGFTSTSLQWVASSYAIVFGGFLLLGGRCADLMGRRKILLAGVVIFTIASLLAGLAGVAHIYARAILIGCRALQGLGGALIAPAALAVVNTTFAEGAERNRALGIFGSIATAGFACGNLLGGVLTGHFGWPSIFFVNVPLGIMLLILAPRLVPASADEHPPFSFDARALDIGGAVTVTLGLVMLVYASVGAEQMGLTSPVTLGCFGLAVALLASFVWIEAHAPNPLIPLSIFRRRTLTAANIVMLFIEGINAASILFISLYLQQVKGFNPQTTGFAFLPLALWMMVAANITPRIVTRFGNRPVMIVGTILTTMSPLLMTQLTPQSSYLGVVLPILIVAGTGMAAAVTAGFIAATSGLADEDQGLASGLIQTSQQVGAALGLAVLVSVSAAHTTAASALGASPVLAQVAGLQAAFWVGTGFSGLGCLIAIFGVPKQPTTATA